MTKTLIVTVPRIEPHRPPPGPAIIAQVCKNLGHDVVGIDLNIKFFHECKKQNVDYTNFDPVWDRIAEPDPTQKKIIDAFIDKWVGKIVEVDYDFIMIGVFGISGTRFTDKFLSTLRPKTSATIIAGGMGIASVGIVDNENCYGKQLKDRGLVDTFITGEGEVALVSALDGQEGPGINNNRPAQIDDINDLPIPDYGIFDLDEYDYLIPGKKDVYITGSRGCVRKCTYCDVENYWPKFRYRSGNSITQEIVQNYEKFGITNFYFTDSLINGSLKSFNDMCEKLAAYPFRDPITWQGQFIFRQRRSIPKDHFAMIKAAGGDTFYVGIETGSNKVRFDMGKKITNDDIDFQLEECSRNGIKIMPLLFTGYITETLNDHHDNLLMFKRWQKYVADGTIIGVELGSNLVILPGAPVHRMIESHGMEFMKGTNGDLGPSLWWSASNPSLTIEERIRRKIEVHETAIKYAWPVWRQESRLNDLKEMILKNDLHVKKPKQFFRIIDAGNSKQVVPGRQI